MVQVYRKTATITAVQWNGDWGPIAEFLTPVERIDGTVWVSEGGMNRLHVDSPEGDVFVPEGGWLARGVEGELYVIGEGFFAKSYEEV